MKWIIRVRTLYGNYPVVYPVGMKNMIGSKHEEPWEFTTDDISDVLKALQETFPLVTRYLVDCVG